MLAVAGGKGGCGKTTTALGLGRALDGETVVVDADRDMPNLHAMAGVPREPTAAEVSVERPHRFDDSCVVLPAPRTTNDGAVPTLLARVDHSTDGRVVVDCPGGAGPDAVAPLSAATRVVLVSTACVPALRDAAKTAAMARAVGCTVVGLVLTRTGVSPPGVTSLFDCPVLGCVPDVEGPVLADERVRRTYRAVAHAITV